MSFLDDRKYPFIATANALPGVGFFRGYIGDAGTTQIVSKGIFEVHEAWSLNSRDRTAIRAITSSSLSEPDPKDVPSFSQYSPPAPPTPGDTSYLLSAAPDKPAIHLEGRSCVLSSTEIHLLQRLGSGGALTGDEVKLLLKRCPQCRCVFAGSQFNLHVLRCGKE